MNTKSTSPLSSIVVKVFLALALTAVMLVVLSGVVVNLNNRIKVQSRAEVVSSKQSFASLPEYGYIQAHQARVVATIKAAPLTGFQALPEYSYIQAHSFGVKSVAYLPAGLRNQAVYDYIQAHNRVDSVGSVTLLAALFPEGLQAMPVYAYIAAHSRPGTQTYVAGLPAGLRNLPEGSYIQMIQESRSR